MGQDENSAEKNGSASKGSETRRSDLGEMKFRGDGTRLIKTQPPRPPKK